MNEKEIQKRQEMNQSFVDKATLIASGSALGFSIAFLKNDFNQISMGQAWLLVISWVCFCLSIIANIYNAYRSAKVASAYSPEDQKKIQNKRTRFLNKCAVVSFIVGIAVLTLFASVSLICSVYKQNKLSQNLHDMRVTHRQKESDQLLYPNMLLKKKRVKEERKEFLPQEPSKAAIEPFPNSNKPSPIIIDPVAR